MVANEMGKFAKKYEERLLHHVNVEAIQLLDISELVRRVKQNTFLADVVIIKIRAQCQCSNHRQQKKIQCVRKQN